MLLAVVFIVFLHQVLYWAWLWQLKEYRLDRFKAGFSWKSLVFQFDLTRWWRPKLTLRAAAVVLISLALFYSWSVLLAPIVVAIAVGISSPPFMIWKKILVLRAKKKMESFSGTVIGITGSFGKSSTKEMLRKVLGTSGQALATENNINSEIGVAQTVLKRLRGDEAYFIVEMGAYRIGEIKAICGIVRPQIGIITGIGDQHLELFKSLENIRKAKFELIESLPKDGFKLIAGQDFTLDEAKDIKVFKDHAEFVYQKQKFKVKILGKSLIRNVLAVIKTGRHLGLSLESISEALGGDFNNIYPKLLTNNVIDNTYNSSLESFLSALEYLQAWEGYKKVVVTSGMIELGKNEAKDYLLIKEKIGFVDKVFVTKKLPFGERVENIKVLGDKLRALAGPKTVFLFQNRCPIPLNQLQSL